MIRYLHPVDHPPARIKKVDKLYGDKSDFKDIKFPVKVRDIRKVEKKNSIGISVFGHENKKKYPIYLTRKCCEDKNVDLMLD